MGVGTAVGRLLERWGGGLEAGASAERVGERKTSTTSSALGLGPGSILMPFRSQGATNVMPKPTAANLRRLAETPAARRAINCIKDRIACMEWRLEARPEVHPDENNDRAERVARLLRPWRRRTRVTASGL